MTLTRKKWIAAAATTLAAVLAVLTWPSAATAAAKLRERPLGTPSDPSILIEWRGTAAGTDVLGRWARRGGDAVAVDITGIVDLVESGADPAPARAALASYTASARKAGLRTYAVVGGATWSAHTYLPGIVAGQLAAYTAEHPDLPLSGVFYDVEPWTVTPFTDAAAAQWLTFAAAASSAHSGTQLHILAPWWIGAGSAPVTFNGATGTVAEHLGAITTAHPGGAAIDVMAYGRTSADMTSRLAGWTSLNADWRLTAEIGPEPDGATLAGTSWNNIADAINTTASGADTVPHFSGTTVDPAASLP